MASGGFASAHNQDCPWTSLGDFRPQRPGLLVNARGRGQLVQFKAEADCRGQTFCLEVSLAQVAENRWSFRALQLVRFRQRQMRRPSAAVSTSLVLAVQLSTCERDDPIIDRSADVATRCSELPRQQSDQ